MTLQCLSPAISCTKLPTAHAEFVSTDMFVLVVVLIMIKQIDRRFDLILVTTRKNEDNGE